MPPAAFALSRRGALRTGAAAAAAALAGCSQRSGGSAGRRRLVLASGPTDGQYEPFARRLAQELRRRVGGLTVHVLTTSASVQNLEMLAAGRADLALALSDSAADAVAGRGAFRTPLPVTALARIYLNYTHLVVAEDSPVRRVTDLAGRRVSLGAVGSGTAVLGERVLRAAGPPRPVRAVRLGLAESCAALAAGEVEAFFWSGGVPTKAIADLAARTLVRLVPLDGLVLALRRAHGPTYVGVSVPAGTYRQAAEVPTVGVPSYLVARRGLSSGLAETVTRVMFRARDRLPGPEVPGSYLDERYAIGTGTVPLHPGAVRYYRSVYG
ncbi:C4-dicarboxylate ABC transporter substrate-binding protein [Actinomadura sp. NBRC 104425]|uniref:TAXI family TRAP transporter solute-binding subunit n=1 Tax=Actinomadura sp. NBRC 104425 TaxID=3032204 RepID=UPI0024A5A3D4|nr:TAXI family TRAP transporter solute-binding subunit [Actinomadura sp. NBRC 104425]GLZ13303.1 C4-dicarboxylate ABC transporter substrate-binding protein [Actinomadura sp. NBRC 104425]